MTDRGRQDTTGEKAAQRGNPSFVWRQGQRRRLSMIQEWVPLSQKRVLDVGCGIGMYTTAFDQLGAQAFGIEVEWERAKQAREQGLMVVQAVGEALPFQRNTFHGVLSHEVIEHVADDRQATAEMVRVAAPGGRLAIFCPNRWYPFETHGHYWRGEYHFGNTPLINYLPNRLRDRLAPHVRTYTSRSLRSLFAPHPVRILLHTQVYPGYDNVVARSRRLGGWLRKVTYLLEHTPLRRLGLSHFMVLEKSA